MPIQLNHTIVHARDSLASTLFLADMLGLAAPVSFGPFHGVALDNGVTLDFLTHDGEIAIEHYAFLVSEDEFDVIFDRIRERKLAYWADPGHQHPGKINHNDGGRGVYWNDPNGHYLEIITQPYGNTKTDPNSLTAHNYCISFIDLLGQRDALRDQGLLPIFKSDEDRQGFNKTLKNSVGAISKLQKRANVMLHEGQKERPNSPLRASLPADQQAIWDEMSRTRVTTQRWSDGLVSFASLGDQTIKCPLNGVFNIFGSAGSLCFMGLASSTPIRGAIDIAWGVEIHPGELYGAAVARAYELESIYAQYPRIVVGQRTIAFLEAHQNNKGEDVFSATNRELAKICLGMLTQDVDGVWILHYLGENFRQAVTHRHHDEFYSEAHKYVDAQLEMHQKSGNSKLAFRYSHLLLYFDAHRPRTGT